MKKITNAALLVLLMASVSCKKDETNISNQQEVFVNKNGNKLAYNEPAGGQMVFLLPQNDGSFMAAWKAGTVKLAYASQRVEPYLDGQPIGNMTIVEVGQTFNSIWSDGPYITAEKGFGMGGGSSIPNLKAGLAQYRDKYEKYITNARDASGALIQPNIPYLADFVSGGGVGSAVFLGKVVMWRNSPSHMAIVPYDYVGPKEVINEE